ncbi:hypothetical protein [Iodobacter fluviatilis]|uniref:Uncharacterized protein n=1 Tax=Iodobacter fluviatilis TaxID=537 RepID=A0A7G3GD34_9NEIS|nr:hypothetical protein [Iodobacter fluviatilis]QBC45221.1 hypothetical protein C1H71_17900 [Iodobacter fluviatilis]
MSFLRNILLVICVFVSLPSYAGIDISGPVQRVQVDAGGNIWFAMDTTAASTYCKPGWFDLTMYIPKSSPEYPYYFAMLLTAASKGNSVFIANISIFVGTEPCDITKTGYGIVFLKN